MTAFATTAVMLSLAQVPVSWWLLAWIGYVPFIFACSPKSKPFRLFVSAYVVGVIFWLVNIYWMSFVTAGGWIAFCLYTAMLWPILALSLRWCRTKRIPLVIAAPVLIVGIEQSQGFLLGGFYWLHLAHSQYANISLIQIADIFGATGISFLVAMVNGAIAEMIVVRRSFNVIRNVTLICAVIFAALGYGRWRVGHAEEYITAGPKIAAVQTNVPQSVKQSFAADVQILEGLLEQSAQCITAEARLIVWPETMVQAILEPRVLDMLDESHIYRQFDKAISDSARKGAYILAGAYGGSPTFEDNFDIRMAQKYNAAFLYTPGGAHSPQKYYKIHLVPFGEVLPFENVPFIHNLLLRFSPYDFDYTIDAGKEFTAFEMRTPDSNEPYRFGVMICYEDAVAGVVRRFALDEDGNKRIDWLVNISNDGWFVRFKDNRVLASTELAQHTAICAFRAVENRTAILRSVNTGISCMIDSSGRIRDGFAAGNLPEKVFDRQGVGGWLAAEVPIDSRITFFSRYGRWLDLSCQLCLGGIIIAQLAERFVIRPKRKAKKKSGGT